jgi:hypothetical protein
MKIALKILFSVFILFFGNSAIYGCICPGVQLRPTFKAAKAVFIGKLSENVLPLKTQGAKNGIVLRVEKSWKGVEGDYFSVTTKFEDWGVCTAFFKKFEKGKKYLIFVEGENFEVRNYCTHSEEIYSSEYPDWYKKQQNRKLEKLDKYGNFWFRFGKRFRLF